MLLHCRNRSDWLQLTLEAIRYQGFAVVEGVLGHEFLESTKAEMYRCQELILRELGRERLEQAGELGVLRLMMRHSSHFFRFLELPEVLAVVDATVTSTAILHLQNGFILPSLGVAAGKVFQNSYHMDFPRVLNGYMASINLLFAIDGFDSMNGATIVVPETHQRHSRPSDEYLVRNSISVDCPAGSMIVFDSTVYHAAGTNASGADRLAINHQFTRSYIKQQIDYVRALGAELVCKQAPRTQQLLGWYTRVVTGLDEYYRPEDERLYRKGQG